MKLVPAALLLCLALLPAWAGAEATPLLLTQPTPTLQLTPGERGFFQLGYQLGRAAFAYAELAKGAAEIAQDRDKLAQVRRLAALAPTADRDRADARDGFARA